MSTNDKLVPGMVLGRYELLLPIAQGGMATVWAARQKGSRGFSKTVAIKTMLPALSDDDMFEKMFLDEAALAARIHHPNVVEILDLGEQDDILYLVMEWIDGEALSVLYKAARKQDIKFRQRIAMRAIIQACGGLHAAHELRDDNDLPLELVHRDVSPQNILVTYDGIVKLVDFGVAKAVNRSSGETTAGQLKGKVPYMSPEQARGGEVDRRTDIFAMGIVLYKLVTGVHPFLGETDIVTMRNIISRPLLPPRIKNPSCSQDLEQVLLKCLQKDPDKRYQTMAELGTALERVLTIMGPDDDDLGNFVRSVMGERGAKRRAAIRDAIRAADERIASGVHAAPVVGAPVVDEGVSEIVLTAMNTGYKEEMLPDRLSSGGSSGSISSPSAISPPPMLSEVPTVVGPRRNRSGLFLGIGVAVAAAAVGLAVLRTGQNSTPVPAASSIPAEAPPPPVSASASAEPTPPVPSTSSSAMSIEDLPTTDDDKGDSAKKKAGGSGSKSNSDPLATSPSTKPTASGKTKPVSTQWVPSVQNPGF